MDLSVQCYNASKLLSTDFKLELDFFFLSLGVHNKAPNHKVFHGFFSGKKSWTTEEAEGNLSFDFPLWSLDKIRDNYTTKTKKIKLLLLETGSKIWIMMEPMSESWHWTHYFLLFPSEDFLLLRKEMPGAPMYGRKEQPVQDRTAWNPQHLQEGFSWFVSQV